MVYKSLDKKETNIGWFLDLSKAFDLADHNMLLKKMGAKASKQVKQNMLWLTSSQKSNSARNCSHFILCLFSITVIIWTDFLGNSVNAKLIFTLHLKMF
jgi:hypothetical protein